MSQKPLTFIAILSTLILFSSCKKNSAGTPPVNPAKPIQFTINGSAVSYANCFYTVPYTNGNFEVIIAATNTVDTQTATSFILNFQIRLVIDASGVKAGQTFPIATSGGQIGTAMLYYTPDGVNDFATQYANAQGTVTITGVTSNMISGTFSGKLFAASDTGGITVVYTITNGIFQASAG